MRVEDIFHQQPPQTGNPYLTDPVLPKLLRRLLSKDALDVVNSDLVRLGDELVNEIRPIAPLVKEPTLTQYDAWGNRVDVLQVSEGWKILKDFACKEGVISIPYERRFGDQSRVWSFAKCVLMVADCHVVLCPYSMTDGAARVMEISGTEKMKREILPRLMSRDPKTAYTSGQWMTESPGGSDVSRTETTAQAVSDEQSSDLGPAYQLDGFKWFSSAAEGNMSIALGRDPSSQRLSLFLVPVRLGPFPTPLSNNILLHRLKDKFGTKALPTAELSLNGARAWLIGAPGAGVRTIAPVLNITRVHSSVSGVGSLMRCLSLARAYAQVRVVDKDKLLQTVPAHMETLARVGLLYRALTHLLFGVVSLLGKSECGTASRSEEARLRILTPTLKAFSAMKSVTAMEDCMAALGGQGYMEELGIGRLIRDAMVEKIWEGTVGVLAHDLMRASRGKDAVQFFVTWCRDIIASAPSDMRTSQPADNLRHGADMLPSQFELAHTHSLVQRPILQMLALLASSTYLLEHAIWSRANESAEQASLDWHVFERWMGEGGFSEISDEIGKMSEAHPERILLNERIVGSRL